VVLTAHPIAVCFFIHASPGNRSAPKFRRSPASTSKRVGGKRLLVGFAEELELDAQGRILVSPALRKFAGLKKDVMLVGQGSHFEIWDIAAWGERLARGLTQVGTDPPPGTENFSL